MADFTPVVGIAVVLFAVAEILKRTVFKNNDDMKAVIPYFCAVVGAGAAAILYTVDPSLIPGSSNILDAVVSGAISGLLATGAHQIYKQFYKLMAIGKSTKEDIDKEVANMTTEEKKEYLTNVAADAVTDFLNKTNGVEEETSESESKDVNPKDNIVTEVHPFNDENATDSTDKNS